MITLDGVAFYGEPSVIGQDARIDTLVNLERQIARLQARQFEVLAAMSTAPVEHELDRQWVKEDVRAALGLSALAAGERLELAAQLTTRLPRTLAALKDGELTLPLARFLVEQTAALEEGVARVVETNALAGDCSNGATFRRRVRRLVLAADARHVEERHEAALAQRRVVFTPTEDGMCTLWALLPAAGAAALRRRLDAAAQKAQAAGDGRSADQVRADALCDAPGTPGPAVQVVVPISMLLGANDQPGDLDGQSIPATVARALANDPHGTWRRLLTDPIGQTLDCGRTRYRPTAALTRHVQTRDRTCRFPGCHRTAPRCELDHITPWTDGGPTDAANLIALCRRHHHLKHDAHWTVTRQPDGTVHWTTPTGHTHQRPPDRYPV